MEALFKGLFDTSSTSVIGVGDFLLCLFIALVCGFMIALVYMLNADTSKSFLLTLAILPAVVCVVIMMVNGNIGAGVAVAGAFGLVRFRSAPGTAKEICMLFTAMGSGLIAGMGYLAYAVLFSVVMCVICFMYEKLARNLKRKPSRERICTVTIPEDLDYTEIFNDIFAEYTSSNELTRVRTTNMGSLFKLTYKVTMKDANREKEMIDKMRCRNGNLEISVSNQETQVAEM